VVCEYGSEHGIVADVELGDSYEDGLVSGQELFGQEFPLALVDHAEDVGDIEMGTPVVGGADGLTKER